jgi:hypothetical protein
MTGIISGSSSVPRTHPRWRTFEPLLVTSSSKWNTTSAVSSNLWVHGVERSCADLTIDVRARDESDSKPAFAPHVPGNAAAAQNTRHLAPELTINDRTPGHEQKLMAVFDQREATRR